MKFTFGIITSSIVPNKVIESIVNQNIPEYEIIIVGGDNEYKNYDVNHFHFDETSGKFTAKKNGITRHAKYENIVYMHDYYFLKENWYEGFKEFGNDWDICMNIILNQDNSRFRDWIICYDRDLESRDFSLDEVRKGRPTRYLPPYNYNKTKNMYISGGYWVAKKYVMEEERLDENLGWGEAEDYEWSERVLWNEKYRYKMNIHSTVQTLKDKRLSAEIL
jgi:hypothetical protein|tara:strand:+ start:4770 stop:5429 length:660 start_codon:yes stop_codon:yes gene_type:complete